LMWASLARDLGLVEAELEDIRDLPDWSDHCQQMLKTLAGWNVNDFCCFLLQFIRRELKRLKDLGFNENEKVNETEKECGHESETEENESKRKHKNEKEKEEETRKRKEDETVSNGRDAKQKEAEEKEEENDLRQRKVLMSIFNLWKIGITLRQMFALPLVQKFFEEDCRAESLYQETLEWWGLNGADIRTLGASHVQRILDKCFVKAAAIYHLSLPLLFID